MVIKTNNIGIAAYIKLDSKLLCKEGRKTFKFESDKSVDEWTIEYYNSKCYKHDLEVMTLRNMINS